MNESLISVEELKQNEMLQNGLLMADRFINKNYLTDLSS